MSTSNVETIEVEGVKYQLSPLSEPDLDELEREYARTKPNPVKEVVKLRGEIPQEEYDMLLKMAYSELTSPGTRARSVAAWMETVEGVSYMIWISLRKKHPDFPRDKVTSALASLGQAAKEALQAKLAEELEKRTKAAAEAKAKA